MLADVILWKLIIQTPKAWFLFGFIKRPKHDIPNTKLSGKVSMKYFFVVCVMPQVKFRTI